MSLWITNREPTLAARTATTMVHLVQGMSPLLLLGRSARTS
jgi:hypothetical protein